MRALLLIAAAAALLAVSTLAIPTSAVAEVSVNVNIGPPPVAVPEPPDVVLIPRSRVYFVPDIDYDIFFYNGYWWSPRGDRWYRARAYNGPWRVVQRRVVPPPVYRVPRDYRHVYMHERHIPYGQWKKGYRDHDRGRRDQWREHRGGPGYGPEEHRGGPPWERGEGGPGRGHHRGRD